MADIKVKEFQQATGRLILLRHGQSIWNQENRFTGWKDVDLSPLGIEEAIAAGKQLEGVLINQVFCSALKRALHTTQLVLENAGQSSCPIAKNAALNERNYGDLEGLNKADVAKQYGSEQVKIWRRSYTARPPNGESLKDTEDRVLPYYKNQIEPLLKEGKTVLIIAHGNSLRSLLKELNHLSDTDVSELEIPTGKPLFFGENT